MNVQIVNLIIVKNLIMEKNDILENNKIIAEFAEIQVTDFQWKDWRALIVGDEDDAIDYDNLQYYSPDRDWNHLINVIEKIESLEDEHHGRFGVDIMSNTCSIQGSNLYRALIDSSYGYVYMSNPEAIFDTKLESTYYNVVEFIKWWNEYKGNKI